MHILCILQSKSTLARVISIRARSMHTMHSFYAYQPSSYYAYSSTLVVVHSTIRTSQYELRQNPESYARARVRYEVPLSPIFSGTYYTSLEYQLLQQYYQSMRNSYAQQIRHMHTNVCIRNIILHTSYYERIMHTSVRVRR